MGWSIKKLGGSQRAELPSGRKTFSSTGRGWHPLAYATFEGTIPEGEYGGGTVMLWDEGTWEPLDDPDEGLKKGKLVFILHGKKLKGEWALVRTALKGAKPNWLLIKKNDEYANVVDDAELLDTVSVKTGRSMEEIAKKNS